jgi:hypothetical protein
MYLADQRGKMARFRSWFGLLKCRFFIVKKLVFLVPEFSDTKLFKGCEIPSLRH